MPARTHALAACAILLSGCAALPTAADLAERQREVAATERAFAQTMADRDHAAFANFLAEEAVFFSGPKPLHGKAAVAAWWKRFYEKPQAPFSWRPEQVEVLPSGTLAMSTGPVYDPQGKQIGTFTSVWRRDAPGVWRIVFDKGDSTCDCPK
ncbi:MAG TPA: nuclear transport factor 2 family protein [Burkholderiaceae bacterium]|nr:nuclear transport factor 2 family protein [Burkholderiaceae bacterium]